MLECKHLSKEEKGRLKARLSMESEDIQDEFALLISETEESLNKTTDPESLRLLLKPYKIPKLSESDDKISKILNKAFDHCFFYSYRILKNIITRFGTPDDKNKLTTYVANFKHYCERRLCEVPYIYAAAAEKNEGKKFYVKTDKVFDVPYKEILDIESRLTNILGKPIYLRDVEDGCVKLGFYVLHELDEIFPLNGEQMKQLKEIGVSRVYDQDHEYYPILKGTNNYTRECNC